MATQNVRIIRYMLLFFYISAITAEIVCAKRARSVYLYMAGTLRPFFPVLDAFAQFLPFDLFLLNGQVGLAAQIAMKSTILRTLKFFFDLQK